MHNLEVVLVITSPDLTKPGNSRFLLLKDEHGKFELPTAIIESHESSLEVAASLLHQLTGLKARILGVGWVDLVPMPLADSVDRKSSAGDRWIGVPYGAMLPGEIVKLNHLTASWVPLTEAFEGEFCFDHKQILQATCHRI